MEKNKEHSDKSHPLTYYVSYRQLGLLFLVFVLGIASFSLIQNLFSKETLQFSTISLIGFVLSVLLSGASIVLAITAIILAKDSEHIMTSRSDESIKLQNDIFIKTTDALKRIESSTDVTEKRIEDIISGRVGAISHQIADIALQERGLKDRTSFENEIRDSLLQQISPQKQIELQKEAHETRLKYKEFQKEVIDSFSSIPDVQIGKIGDGRFEGTGDDLFDGIFLLKGQRLGVSVFGSQHMKNISFDYIFKISNEIMKNRISKTYFVLDAPAEEQNQLVERYLPYNEVLKDNVSDKIKIIAGTKDIIKKLLLDIFTT